jgi:mRNA-degrading endonuclease RelE of RelBE toxin-antitoxin system
VARYNIRIKQTACGQSGNYCILYAVEDRVLVVQVIKIGHHKIVYRV